MKFRIFSRRTLRGKRWYFHAKDVGNNEIILQSEGYRNHTDAHSAVCMIKDEAGTAEIDDSEWWKSQ